MSRILGAAAAVLMCAAQTAGAAPHLASPARESVHFTSATVRGSVVLRLVGVRGRHVALTFAGRTIAHLRGEPYRISFSKLKAPLRHPRKVLVARDARSGRQLARVRVLWSPVRPSVAITSAPPGATTATDATISFSTTVAGRITCSLDSSSPKACSSPLLYAGLGLGVHTVVVRNTYAGRTATASVSWTVMSAPTVELTSAPTGTTTTASADVAFVATHATAVTCSLDGAPATACSSPQSLSGLADGSHTFLVRAANDAASAQALASWSIATPSAAPAAAPAPAPAPGPAPAPPAPAPAPAPQPSVAPSGPAAPNPPAAYDLPSGATTVSTSAQLLAALANPTPSDIVLADGSYDNAAPFSDANDHRIYAAHVGGAVLHAGIVVGGNFGPGGGLIRGIAFDVTDPTKTFEGGIVQTWGASGRNTQILDTTFDGHGAVQTGILARQVEGLVVRRVVLQNFQSYGLFEDENVQGATVSTPAVLEDVSVANVARPTPRSSNGTAEACIWLGNTATLRRARAGNCAWTGLWTGTAFANGLVTDLSVDATPVGLYLEHFTTGSTFQNMQVGANVAIGVNCEWADPSWGSRPACNGDTFQNSTFDTQRAGVYLDQGTTAVTVTGCRFLHQSWAAIGAYQGIGNTFTGNDYSGIAGTATAVSTNHI